MRAFIVHTGLVIGFLMVSLNPISAQETAETTPKSSAEILGLAWKASHEGDFNAVQTIVAQMLAGYEAQAKEQSASLKDFPAKNQIENFKIMNDVATCLFVKAEFLMHQGRNDESKELFQSIIKQYPWAQSFDPSRGSFWSVQEKSQASIDVMSGHIPHEVFELKEKPRTRPVLGRPGKQKVMDYSKFGIFHHLGTKEYRYQILDRKGLAEAAGEGIYPNLTDVYKNPGYKKAKAEGRLEGSHWDFINTTDLEAAYFKWATAHEPEGIKLFYLGTIFEKAKMFHEAIKSYQAIMVHFPQTIAWTYWHTPWYPSQAALAKIHHIIRMHPDLKLEFKDARIRILNSYDNDPANDATITHPGVLRQLKTFSKPPIKKRIPLNKPVRSLGNGKVRLVQYGNKHWRILVDNKPFLIKGVTYSPTMVGQSPDNGTLSNWMTDDFNRNGRIDGPYDAWMDMNKNGIQDQDEPTVGDFALMKEMGVNTLRIYDHPSRPINKEFLRAMHKEFGFMVLLGDMIGKYAIGSGASWAEGTDYENPVHQKKMMEAVRKLVLEYKDEPYILMWLLGNENNYGVASNADKKPDAFYKFANEVAKMIKAIDPNHPVALCNGDILYLDKFAKHGTDIDAYGGNVYRGDYGFGAYWQQISDVTGKPAFITEYGAPAFSGKDLTPEDALDAQAAYHKGNWLDIYYNSAGFMEGEGNSIGGVAFEWLDEWWKNYEPAIHDQKADVIGPFPGGYYYEEWFGLLGQGDGKQSPYLREPRKVYFTYKELWNSQQ